MENLTLSMKLYKPHTIDPLEGHTVVILETVGDAGEELRFEIEPGQSVPRTRIGLFETLRGRKPPNYFAFAVTGMPELRWTFTADVTLDIQAHAFTLLVTLAYRVSEPRLLVSRRNDDPIRQVRDYIAGLLSREFAQRSWGDIRHGFRQVERDVVAATIGSVRQFAAYFGVHVHDLSLSHRLQEKDFADILAEEQAEAAKAEAMREGEVARVKLAEIARIEAQSADATHEQALKEKDYQQELAMRELHNQVDRRAHELLVSTHRRDDMVNEAFAEAAVAAIRAAGMTIQTHDDLLRVIGKMRGAADQLSISGGTSSKILVVGTPIGNNGQNGVAATLVEALDQTERMGFDLAQKQRLQSAILHLVAELLLDGQARDTVITACAAQIDEFRHEPKLARTHAEYLKKFVNGDVRVELR